jgi:hypothetical protein
MKNPVAAGKTTYKSERVPEDICLKQLASRFGHEILGFDP